MQKFNDEGDYIRWLNLNVTPDQVGQPIRDEDVVRPLNHMFTPRNGKEIKDWLERTIERIPTYGSCTSCYRSGPVGKVCNACLQPGSDPSYARFLVLMTDDRVLDSLTIADILEKEHVIARADEQCTWSTTTVPCVVADMMNYRTRMAFPEVADPAERAAKQERALVSLLELYD